MAQVKYSIEAESLTATKTSVKARGFEFLIDEPERVGGENAALTPVEYLLGAFSGCMNVVGHKVAKEMGITVKSLRFEFEGNLDSDRFMGKPTDQRCGFQEIRAKIIADVDADPEQKLAWVKAVKERCPVSDNIANLTPVKITLE